MAWPRFLLLALVLGVIGVSGCARSAPRPPVEGVAAMDTSVVRHELEQWYEQNERAMWAEDVDSVMALRTEDFHSVTPDGARHDRAEMEQRTRALFESVDRWIAMSNDLDSLEVSGDLASAVVRQHVTRMARRSDGLIHHVETWVTQRETWRRTAGGWKLYRVDNLRDQRRLIDGQPG